MPALKENMSDGVDESLTRSVSASKRQMTLRNWLSAGKAKIPSKLSRRTSAPAKVQARKPLRKTSGNQIHDNDIFTSNSGKSGSKLITASQLQKRKNVTSVQLTSEDEIESQGSSRRIVSHVLITNGFPTVASCLPPRDHPLRPLSPRRSSALHISVSVQTRRKVTGRTSQSVKGLGTSLPSRSRRATTSPLNEASDDGSEFCVSSEDRLESPESSDMDMLSEHSSPATEFEDDSDIPAQKRRKLVSGPVKSKRATKRTTNATCAKRKLAKREETEGGANIEPGPEKRATKFTRGLNKPYRRSTPVKMPKGLDQSLPPMHDIKEIFLDLTKKAVKLGLNKAIDHLGSRRLRVATMCSGTESPLLAMRLIAQSLASLNHQALQFEHLFSAEIVPFKQAYIERNFQPAIIFRDITEMTSKHSRNSEATTAYGAKVPIPGDVDILIAGAACVDFSMLNQHKKHIDDDGESGDTFRAVLHYCLIWRPRVVILENVLGAPWDAEIKPQFEGAGYETTWVEADTKNYYLPQTRQRGYMLCVDKNSLTFHPHLTRKWAEIMFALERRASSPVSDFLLPDDDPRIQQGRLTAMREFDDVREYAWVNCQARHSKIRQQLRLGFRRPLTHWEAGVACQVPDYVDTNYIHKQVERVWDTLDCSLLRKALPAKGPPPHDGYDAQFKTRVWELSQNVDRATDSHPFGISPCITPTGNPYVTDRGGPLTGIESLGVQGLPINELTFTSESQKNLQDLAGNAMSSTVVGSAFLAALVAAYTVLPSGEGSSLPPGNAQDGSDMYKQVDIAWSTKLTTGTTVLGKSIADLDLSLLLSDAERSCRRCLCEGRTTVAESPIQMCKLCFQTTCTRCGRHPKHDYTAAPFPRSDRLMPSDFEERWAHWFPVRLRITGLASQNFIDAVEGLELLVDKETWPGFLAVVDDAVQQEIRFESFNRAHAWTVIYSSPTARLELVVEDGGCEWRLYARPAAHLAADGRLRRLLERPVASAKPTSNKLMDCDWYLRLPSRAFSLISIRGVGEKTDSWRSRLGLMDYENEKVWRTIEVEVPSADKIMFAEEISGTYQILPDCGTASGSLHKRVSGPLPSGAHAAPEVVNEHPFFLFLDPARIGNPAEDCCVFSKDIRRLRYGECRSTTARLHPNWRPWSFSESTSVKCHVEGKWAAVQPGTVRLEVIDVQLSVQTVPEEQQDIGQRTDTLPELRHCATATALLSCHFQSPSNMDQSWTGQGWKAIDISDMRFYTSFAWLLQKVSNLVVLEKWRTLDGTEFSTKCLSCAPNSPPIKWSSKKGSLIPYEDSQKARRFEHAVKARPSIFQIRLCMPNNSDAKLQLGIDVHSLVHRAIARVFQGKAEEKLSLAWNFCPKYSPPPRQLLKPYRLLNNRGDAELNQTPRFQLDLRRDQKRSLSWMRNQEGPLVEPFEIEAIEEVLLPQLRWKAEARARRPIVVRGGVLADEPGYGKTITSLALIDAGFNDTETSGSTQHVDEEAYPGLVSVEATLVVCPKHLVEQWDSEIGRSLGKPYKGKVIKIKTMADLGMHTVQTFQSARIVVISWDVLQSATYLSKLAFFAAVPNPPNKLGRPFQVWLQYALDRFPDHADILQNNAFGVAGLQNNIREKLAALATDEEFRRNVPSKRLRGQQYVQHKARMAASAGHRKERDGDSDGDHEESSDSEEDEDFETFIANNALTYSKSSDWTTLKGPPIHLFKFNRVIVDEFALLQGKNHAIISNIASDKTWVLSGTPPLTSFGDVSTIASFLKIKLGGDDIDTGTVSTRKDLHTAAEQFHAFRGARSAAWHEHRQRYAQAFLDRYVRHNIPEIDEIEFVELLSAGELSANDRALYTELSAYVMTQDMRIKTGKKKTVSDIDREERILQSLDNCQTPEEALLKRCVASEGQSLDGILQHRQRQHDNLVQILHEKLKQAEALRRQLGRVEAEYYEIWKGEVANALYGDPDAMRILVDSISTEDPASLGTDGKLKQVSQPVQTKGKTTVSVNKLEAKNRLQETTVYLRKVSAELITHSRSLRLIRNLVTLQNHIGSAHDHNMEILCDGNECLRSNCGLLDMAVSSTCGHIICPDCLGRRLLDGRCLALGCQVRLQRWNLFQAKDLVSKDSPTQDAGTGARDKIGAVIRLLQEIKDKDEQALLFVQFSSLVTVVQAALEESGITFHTMDDDDPESSDTLKEFQTNLGPSKKQVLILNCATETAAGANLFNANHIIFLSPLLVGSQQRYEAAMKQAIGRAVRYGQLNKVHIYRFFTLSTIDVDILQHRERRNDVLYADGTVVKKQALVKSAAAVGGSPEDTKDDLQEEERKEKIKVIKDKNGLVGFAPISWSRDTDSGQGFGTGVHEVSRYFLDA